MKALLLILAFCLTAVAQDKAPLPSDILNAKTVFLVNTGGKAEAFDHFYSEVKKWGRYQLVDAPEKADLVFEFSFGSQGEPTKVYTNPANLRTYSYNENRVGIVIKKGKDVLWSNSLLVKGTKKKTEQKTIRELVSDLDQRTRP